MAIAATVSSTQEDLPMEGDQPPKDLNLLMDAELVVRAQLGSADQREEAIDELSERFGQVAFRSAMAILHNDDAARDVAQETLVRLLTRIDTMTFSRTATLHRRASCVTSACAPTVSLACARSASCAARRR